MRQSYTAQTPYALALISSLALHFFILKGIPRGEQNSDSVAIKIQPRTGRQSQTTSSPPRIEATKLEESPPVDVQNRAQTIELTNSSRLARDLSADAILIPNSFTIPAYTSEALAANLEGQYIVDVFVDEKGNVLKANLRNKIGFRMDERVLEVARTARFVPHKDSHGSATSGWSELKFYLELDANN